MHHVYVLRSEKNGKFYVGYSEDVQRRLEQNNCGKVQATRYLRPLALVYTEACGTEIEASRRERHIKGQKSRKYIQGMIDAVKGL